MKHDEKPFADFLAQLLTTDYGGPQIKRRCLIRLLEEPDLARQALERLGRHSSPMTGCELKVPGALPEPIHLLGEGRSASEQVIHDRSEESGSPGEDQGQYRLNEEGLYLVLHAVHQYLKVWGSSDAAMERVYQATLQIPKAWGLTKDEMTGLLTQEDMISHVLDIWEALDILIPNHQALAWVKKPNDNPLFGGESALNLMLQGRLGEVRNYLFSQLNSW